MSMSSNGGLRRLWLNIHLWIGIGLGLVLVPLSLTGSALVWHDGMERLLHPSRYAVTGIETMLPPSAYLDAGQAALGDDIAASSLRMPEEEGDPVVVAGRGQPSKPGERPSFLSVYLDPPTGKVLGVSNFRASFMGVMHDFHGHLMVPGIGRQIVGWLGVAMLISSFTGIWLWWPRNHDFKFAFAWRRAPTTSSNLHHMFGFWIAIPLAVLSFTGMYISFPQTARMVAGIFADMPEASQRPRGGRFGGPPVIPSMTPQAAIDAAETVAPGARFMSLNLPSGDNPVWRIQMLSAEGENKSLTVNDKTGAVEIQSEDGNSRRDPVARLMRRIHDGGGMGIVWQTIIFIGGILPALLAVTGLLMWLRKRKNRKAMQTNMAGAD